jgi:hypothetical protein
MDGGFAADIPALPACRHRRLGTGGGSPHGATSSRAGMAGRCGTRVALAAG